MPPEGQRAQFQPQAKRASSKQLTGSHRGVESPMSQGDGDAIKALILYSRAFLGLRPSPQPLQPCPRWSLIV